ncbi:MAG: energy transducer TonB [Saprospiraceae bacterium]|nr:energy transducer TonB [Saprospiraceae bacterium]
MFSYLLHSSICLILFYGVYLLFLKKERFFRYNRMYILSSLLLSALIPIVGPWIVLPFKPTSAVYSAIEQNFEAINQRTHTETSGLDYHTLLDYLPFLIYGLGVALFLIRLFHSIYRIYKYQQGAEVKWINGVRIIFTQSVHLPFSFFKTIYISRNFPAGDRLHTILEHESVHIRQWHSLDVLCLEVIHAFFWFNPVMILYKKSLKEIHEYLADAWVCRKINAFEYAEILLSQSVSDLELSLANHFFQSQLKNRIHMLTTKSGQKTALWKLGVAIPVFMLVIYAFATPGMPSQIVKVMLPSPDTLPPKPPLPPVAPLPPNPVPVEIRLDKPSVPVSPPVPPVPPAVKDDSAMPEGKKPLIVIDGVVTGNTAEPDINPEIIAAITVLRSDAAVSKYGSKGQHGAIEITTHAASGYNKDKGKPEASAYNESRAVDEMPRFPGCEHLSPPERDACARSILMEYIGKNLKYPSDAFSNAVEGTCVVVFVVTADGDIEDIRLKKDIGYGCGEEVLKVVSGMNQMKEKWIPARRDGKAVNAEYTLPVKFRMQ